MKNENPDLQSDCSVHTTLQSHRGCLSEYAKEIGLKSRLVPSKIGKDVTGPSRL